MKNKAPSGDENKKILALLESLTTKINELEEKVSSQQAAIESPAAYRSEFKAPDAVASTYKPKGYVPQNYRQIIDEVLSSEFGFDCEENPANMDFKITIVVPERFSSLTAAEKQAGMQDTRSKVISRAIGELGVREWAAKVRENLNRFYTQSGVVSPFTKA